MSIVELLKLQNKITQRQMSEYDWLTQVNTLYRVYCELLALSFACPGSITNDVDNDLKTENRDKLFPDIQETMDNTYLF